MLKTRKAQVLFLLANVSSIVITVSARAVDTSSGDALVPAIPIVCLSCEV